MKEAASFIFLFLDAFIHNLQLKKKGVVSIYPPGVIT